MNMKEMSFNLAQVAYSLANWPHSGVCLDMNEATIETLALESLELDEAIALKAFLSKNHPITRLLSNTDNPPVENNWWGS